ncbi:MAG: leucine-rich repeat domain-containing protein, partial [Clostridia bacterium]|nr:leucine-rich repeat domain-containing protein [Clostridia bacterium]
RVIIPDTVKEIASYAFNRCSLTEIVIPDSVTTIGICAFRDCSSVASITIGKGVKTIGDNAFQLNRDLETKELTINYDGPMSGWCNISGLGALMGYNVGNKRTLIIDGQEIAGTLTIPDGVTNIDRYAFYGCDKLTQITIGKSVTSIGSLAFNGCGLLNSITVSPENAALHIANNCLIATESKTMLFGWGSCTIPSDGSVTSIAEYAAYENLVLTSITIPGSVTTIGKQAFSECKVLTQVTISDGVTIIDDHAFYNCKELTSVTMGNTVERIGTSAFYWCRKLQTIVISATVTYIGNSAFADCYQLDRIYFRGTSDQWKAIEKVGSWSSSMGRDALNGYTKYTYNYAG